MPGTVRRTRVIPGLRTEHASPSPRVGFLNSHIEWISERSFIPFEQSYCFPGTHCLFNMVTESSFPVLTANLDLRGELYQANKKLWEPVLKRFENALRQVSAEGNEVSLKRHQSRGQLLRKYTLAPLGTQYLTIGNSQRSGRVVVGSGLAFSGTGSLCRICE
jgi:hypothetical protein